MDWKRIFFKITLGCFLSAILTSCNNEFDYSRLSINKMDLSGAKSLVLIKDKSTRAINGDFLSAGLYKIDEAGNLTAVAVYFTQDKNGGHYKESTHNLTVVPKELFDISEHYMITYKCKYFDKDGDETYVPYSDLLIRKGDGRIWDITDHLWSRGGPISLNFEEYGPKRFFSESNDGNLYYNGKTNEVYKFNLDSSTPSIEQVTKNGNFYLDINIQDNGALWSTDGDYLIQIAWPYSGNRSIYYDTLHKWEFGDENRFELSQSENNDYKYYFELLPLTYCCSIRNKPLIIFNPSINIFNRDFPYSRLDEVYQFCQENIKPERAAFLEIGDSYEDVRLNSTPIILQEYPTDFILQEYPTDSNKKFSIKGIYPGKDYVFIMVSGIKPWLTLIDLKSNEWRWIKQCDLNFGSNAAEIRTGGNRSVKAVEYSNKLWSIDVKEDHFGCYWIDLNTFEEGFIPFDFSQSEIKLDYIFYSVDFNENGTFTKEWISSKDGNKYYLTINILTGSGEITKEEPDMYYGTLIPLN